MSRPPDPPVSESGLEPTDFEAFRALAHQLLDECLDRWQDHANRPWQPVPDEAVAAYHLPVGAPGIGLEAMARAMTEQVLPHGGGNTHPRFFGWVQGSGLPAGLLADMVAATMNSNCGGRDHGAMYVERAVIRWCAETLGMPSGTSGILVTGTSQSTVIALACARQWALGPEVRSAGMRNQKPLTAYATEGAHHCIRRALELLGIGSSALRLMPLKGENQGMDVEALAARVAEDRASGFLPFCVVGTAGSVELGLYDDFRQIAAFCQRERLWFHVDGAFGAWIKLARFPWCDLVSGIGEADSISLDMHKWLYLQYDCGLTLIRDAALHYATFASRPSYLAVQETGGLGGGDLWFCDYGVDLSRGFRALKVWAAIRAHGRQGLGEAITANLEQTAELGRLIGQSKVLDLVAPVVSNVCCFTVRSDHLEKAALSQLNQLLARRLQISGEAVFSTCQIEGREVLRAAITNHRTRTEDIRIAVAALEREARTLLAEQGAP